MDTSLIYGIGGVAIGMLLGWLIASLRVQQTNAQHETELRLLEQALQQAQQETAARQETLQRHEQQLRIAAGEALSFTQSDVQLRGHAVEARIYAEDPARDFLPTGGKVLAVHHGSGNRVRFDTGIYADMVVGSDYDPMLAKVIAHGADLRQATARVRQALEELEIAGVDTNADLLHGVVTADDFTERPWTTAFIPDHLGELVAHRRPRSVVPDDAAESASVAVEPDLAESAVAQDV